MWLFGGDYDDSESEKDKIAPLYSLDVDTKVGVVWKTRAWVLREYVFLNSLAILP